MLLRRIKQQFAAHTAAYARRLRTYGSRVFSIVRRVLTPYLTGGKDRFGRIVTYIIRHRLSHILIQQGRTLWRRRRIRYPLLVFLLYLCVSAVSSLLLPRALFHTPYSDVLYSKDGMLLGARIADDQQWRFPATPEIPEKYRRALLSYEDRRFSYHPGIDPVAVVRACRDNIKHGTIVSGASTLSMQVIRLFCSKSERTWGQKITESFLTLGLEFRYSKDEILALYAAHAPFGGNVVGLRAASWRYFNRSPDALSWAESALLAVLPNSPSLIHPGRNRTMLKAKRDFLLHRLHETGELDRTTCALACSEPLPEAPHPLPRLAPHLLTTLAARHEEKAEFHSTLSSETQRRLDSIVQKHHRNLSAQGINNICALVIDNDTGQVRGYVGNSPDRHDTITESAFTNTGYAVDIIQKPRSTGSILKPLLYAAMLHDGDITPTMLIQDIPRHFGGFMPKNFSRTYRGAVPARRALALSLNIPAVAMLQEYSYQRFYRLLKRFGMTTLFRPADQYGLTLILGGAEGTLWDIASIYSALARVATDRKPLTPALLTDTDNTETRIQGISPGSAYLTMEALLDVKRPGIDGYWHSFHSAQKIAWKTGTSLGHRDTWAVGVTKKYTVGVWCGNADGEGKPGMTGLTVTAPLLFEVFSSLPRSSWFTPPHHDLKTIRVCKESGYLPNAHCPTKMVDIPLSSHYEKQCPYHIRIHTDTTGNYRVTNRCESTAQMKHLSWFVLPPAQEYYYVKHNSGYAKLPPFRSDCVKDGSRHQRTPISLIYPAHNTSVYIPVDISGEKSEVIMQAAHTDADVTLFWHLDDTYIGSTRTFHSIAIQPEPGRHTITLVDDTGTTLEQRFTVIGKAKE